MIDSQSGKNIALKRRDHVCAIISNLEKSVAKPICVYFNLSYNLLGEHHPNERKAGITTKERVLTTGAFRWTIRVRIRSRTDPISTFFSHGTHLAVLLHEIAHLRFMNHGIDFAIFLRDIYRYAYGLGIFACDPKNELPSPWEWERKIWDSKGAITDSELFQLVNMGT